MKSDMLEGFVVVTSGTTEDRGGEEGKPLKEYNCQRRLKWVPEMDGTEKIYSMPKSGEA